MSLINGKQEPSQAIVMEIFQISTALGTFQRMINTLGTPKDTPELRQKLQKTRLHIAQLLKDTSAKLKQASETDSRAKDRAGKKITAKLAKEFETVLKEFQKAQRLAAQRETTYTPVVTKSSLLPSNVDVTSQKNPEQRALLVESSRQKVLLFDNEISYNDASIEEMDQGIQEISEQIDEVNAILKDLFVLVHEQGVMIDYNFHAATAQGSAQLVKAAKTQRSNSSLTCLLLVIFGIVLSIIIIVIAAFSLF